jgi:hypothetical protein
VPENRRNREPVFVDRTGRRRRLIALAGSAGGLVLTVALLAVAVAFTGAGPVSLPRWPESAAGAVIGDPATRPPSDARRSTAPRQQDAERTAEPAPVRPADAARASATAAPAPSPTASGTPSASPSSTRGRGSRPTHTSAPTQTPGPRVSRTG